MLIIGERINTSRASVRKAVETKDAAFIQNEARKQLEAGANMLDVNCGTSLENEPEDLAWLVKTVQGAVSAPLCIDSPNPLALERALSSHEGRALINSITLEKSRYENTLPLVKKYKSDVVALTIDGQSVPETAQERFRIAGRILKVIKSYGISEENVYFDPLVKPIASSPGQAREFLEGIRLIKGLGKVKLIGGLSNVSFGLPERSLLNAVFFAMAYCAGIDAAIVDPLDVRIHSAIAASRAIMGEDNYCKDYISAYREKKL